jgi:hypothetical protein
MENHATDEIVGHTADAPYINGAIVTCAPEEFIPGSGDGTAGNYVTATDRERPRWMSTAGRRRSNSTRTSTTPSSIYFPLGTTARRRQGPFIHTAVTRGPPSFG